MLARIRRPGAIVPGHLHLSELISPWKMESSGLPPPAAISKVPEVKMVSTSKDQQFLRISFSDDLAVVSIGFSGKSCFTRIMKCHHCLPVSVSASVSARSVSVSVMSDVASMSVPVEHDLFRCPKTAVPAL